MSVEAPLIRDILNGTLNSRIEGSQFGSAFDYTKQTQAEKDANVTPTNYSWPPGDIRRYGGTEDSTLFASNALFEANNKAALQIAITASASSGGFVLVPWGCDYGYVVTTRSTWPDFSTVTSDVLIEDYSRGSSYAPPAKDGAQARWFYHTAQTATPGQHDGNGQWIRGDWAPYLWIDNQMDLSGARTASDNRRAKVFFGRNGVAAWGLGMGSLSSAAATDSDLSSFALQVFDGPLVNSAPWVVHLATNNQNFGTSSNGLEASFWFKSPVTGYFQMVLESLTTTSTFYLRTSNGSTDDAGMRNVAGLLSLNISSQGDALSVVKATRDVLIGTATDDTSAKLNVTSTTQGFLPPRMTTAQKNAISGPASGLIVFDTDLQKLCVRVTGAWQTITSV